MIENWLRSALPRLQPIYDYSPYPLRHILTTIRGLVLTRLRYQNAFWQCLDELMHRERMTLTEIETFQNEQLRSLTAYAYNHVPYYRKLFKQNHLSVDDIRSCQDLPKLPLLTRETVRENWQQLISTAIPDKERITVYTSGTSGAGLPVVYDEAALVKSFAYAARQKNWAGVDPRAWRISLFGSKIVPIHQKRPPFWAYNYFEKQILMSIFHLADAYKDHYINFLLAHQNWVLEGFPTVLSILSDFILRDKMTIPMQAIFTDGEPLYSFIRDKIETSFSAKIYDSYGMTEWAGLIQECEFGKCHLVSDYGILEILDEDQNPVPKGQDGYLVWTGFINRAMPFIRYRIGDRGMWDVDQTCLCGRPFPLVHPTISRDGDSIVTPDGRILSPRAMNQLLKNKMSFKACQFIQKKDQTIVIRIVPRDHDTNKEIAEICKGLSNILGDESKIEVEEAEQPIQRSSGKVPLVIVNH